MGSIDRLRPDSMYSSPVFSQLVVVPPDATTIYIGAQNAVDESGAMIGEADIAAQIHQVMHNVRTALATADATLADVISYSMLLEASVDINAAYAAAMDDLDVGGDPPLITVALVSGLAVPGALIELSAIAAVLR